MLKENYLNEKYDFKFNEITNRTYFRKKNGSEKFELINQYVANSLKREINNYNIRCSVSDLKSLLESDYVPKFNPFKDYFYNLPSWDKNTDYIEKLAETIETDKTDDFKWAFKKWIVASVACALHDNITNQAILIFTGGQGIGKTTWMSKLVPESLKEYFYSGIINPENKDNTILLSERFIINLDELASLNKRQIEAFKEMVTKEVISERRPYGHFVENYIRRASFVGSSNHNQILTDVTGNRRFICFEVQSINKDHNVDMDLVYAQVMHILNEAIFEYHFNLDDIKRIEANNQQFKQVCEEEEFIDEFFKLPEGHSQVNYLSATEIANYFKNMGNSYSKYNPVDIGKIMKAKGYITKKISGSSKYIIELTKN